MTSTTANHDTAARLVDHLTAPSAVADVVLSAYLTGSRSTGVFRADSDWDIVLVLRPDRDDADIAAACRDLALGVAALREDRGYPGEISVPKIARLPVVRRCLQWDASSFGELFWRHGVLLSGPEVRSGPLGTADPAVRRLVTRASIARSLIQIQYFLWKFGDFSDVFRLQFSHVGRVLRALRYHHDGTYPVATEAAVETLVTLCRLGDGDPIVRAVDEGTRDGSVLLRVTDWARLIGAVARAAGIDDPERLRDYPLFDASAGDALPAPDRTGTRWLPVDRPIPWETRWHVTDSLPPGGVVSRRAHPTVTRNLAALRYRWSRSTHWRSTFFSYLTYNRWNKLVDVLDETRGGAAGFPSSRLRADLVRVGHLLRTIPFDTIPQDDVDRLLAVLMTSPAGFTAAWQELCGLLEARGDQLAMPTRLA